VRPGAGYQRRYGLDLSAVRWRGGGHGHPRLFTGDDVPVVPVHATAPRRSPSGGGSTRSRRSPRLRVRAPSPRPVQTTRPHPGRRRTSRRGGDIPRDGVVRHGGELPGIAQRPGQIERFRHIHDGLGRLHGVRRGGDERVSTAKRIPEVPQPREVVRRTMSCRIDLMTASGNFHMRHRAAIWPRPGRLSWPLSCPGKAGPTSILGTARRARGSRPGRSAEPVCWLILVPQTRGYS
jgi:hypothetical protein